MSTRLQRFDFGAMRDFRKPVPVAVAIDDASLALPEAPPPPPKFSEQELNAARHVAHQEGYDDGLAAGLAQAAGAADGEETQAIAAMNRMAEQIDSLDARYGELIAHESQELSALVLMIARKVAGDALSAHYSDAIQTLVAQCLPVFLSRPRLLVDVHPDALVKVSSRVETLLQQRGFEGEVQFRSNAALDLADAVLDWGHGQARRSTQALWQEIETLLGKLPIAVTLAAAANPPMLDVVETFNDTPTHESLITPEPGV
ncbi:MAG: hypothetical protein ACKVOE_07910 [Rickettsiales bacterium]